MFKPRTLSERPPLGPQLPLDRPHVILVDPSSSCNLRCKFCPTGSPDLIKSTGRFQGQMSLEIFSEIIKGIETCKDPVNILRLYKEGEPLLNKNFCEFVRLAKNSSNIRRVDTTTNGLLLSHKLSENLIESGIDQINISLNGLTPKHYLDYTNMKVDTIELIDQILYLCSISGNTTIYVKCIKEHLNPDERVKFVEIFKDVADKFFLEGLQPNWPSFDFDYIQPTYDKGHYGQDLILRDVCPFIFYMMVVNSDGSVSACVQDWNHSLIVGHVLESPISEIWSSDLFNDLRLSHLNKQKNNYSNCANCPVLRHGCLDNIDPFIDSLQKYYE